jgi:hypothetical protein
MLMEDRIITVPELSIRVVTGDSCYHGENGFSAIYSEVTPDNAALQRQLATAQKDQLIVTLRCAMLDVTGRITNCRTEGKGKTFVLSVEDMVYRKPREPSSGIQADARTSRR